MTGGLPEFEKECFFITPIGDEGSDVRRRADDVLEAIVGPAAETLGLTAIRADRIGEGGQVNLQVIEHVCRSATAIVDLTGGNLNVYYEVGMRHTTRLPLVLIADEAERSSLPFDILVQRTIFFTNDMKGVALCKGQAVEQLRAGIAGSIDSPIGAAVNIRQFQQGDAVERTLAELVTSVDGLSRAVSRERPVSSAAIRDLQMVTVELQRIADASQDQELQAVCRALMIPVRHIASRDRSRGSRGDSDAEAEDRVAARTRMRELLDREGRNLRRDLDEERTLPEVEPSKPESPARPRRPKPTTPSKSAKRESAAKPMPARGPASRPESS